MDQLGLIGQLPNEWLAKQAIHPPTKRLMALLPMFHRVPSFTCVNSPCLMINFQFLMVNKLECFMINTLMLAVFITVPC